MKRWLEPLSSAWIGVATHKLRSFLTMLGIVIGVSAVIALMSVGKGAEATIVTRISGLGSDLIYIRPGATTGIGGIMGAMGSADTLTLEDAAAIVEEIPNISIVAPSYSTSLQIVAGGQNIRASVNGISPEYQQALNLNIASGIFISDNDYQRNAKVAVLGSNVKEALFEDDNPVGQQIRMGNNVVRVIGVLESQGTSMRGTSDDAILIPLSAMQQIVAESKTSTGEHIVSSIALTVVDERQVTNTIDEITELIRYRHELGPGVDNDFNITSMEELASTLTETTETLTFLLGAIAAISLVVGGIGVMNIMLVSVLERTREIGILKALGAKERDIRMQFLLEAVLLTFAGGIIGVGGGWAVSMVIPSILPLTTLVTADIVVLAVSVSVGIGLFFGFYPAWNASRLNPIDALRAE